MRPSTFSPAILRRYLLRHKIAELPQLKRVLGTSVDLTVFRKLQHLGYLTSYSHRGRFYTLQEIARFDARGRWSHEGVWFSRYGSLVDTVEAFVQASANGYYAPELADLLQVEAQEPLRHLVRQQRLSRSAIGGRFLYTAVDSTLRRQQTLARRSANSYRWRFTPRPCSSLLMNSRPPSSCFMDCWTSSSAACSRGSSPCGSGMAATSS